MPAHSIPQEAGLTGNDTPSGSLTTASTSSHCQSRGNSREYIDADRSGIASTASGSYSTSAPSTTVASGRARCIRIVTTAVCSVGVVSMMPRATASMSSEVREVPLSRTEREAQPVPWPRLRGEAIHNQEAKGPDLQRSQHVQHALLQVWRSRSVGDSEEEDRTHHRARHVDRAGAQDPTMSTISSARSCCA